MMNVARRLLAPIALVVGCGLCSLWSFAGHRCSDTDEA